MAITRKRESASISDAVAVPPFHNTPRTLRSAEAVAARRSLLTSPHMAPLLRLTEVLRNDGRGTVPGFRSAGWRHRGADLVLLEKPGPMTDDSRALGRIGSGFISRDNDDPTAEATFRFMIEAGLARDQTLIWNAVPWWNVTRRIRPDEQAAGLRRLSDLLALLPRLDVVVAVGNRPKRAARLIRDHGLPFLSSLHPSPLNRASRYAQWAQIPAQWAQAQQYLR